MKTFQFVKMNEFNGNVYLNNKCRIVSCKQAATYKTNEEVLNDWEPAWEYAFKMDVMFSAYKTTTLGHAEYNDVYLVIDSKDFQDYADQDGILRTDIDYSFIKNNIMKSFIEKFQ